MSKTTSLNIILGVLASGLVAILVFLRVADDPVAVAPVTVPSSVADSTSTEVTSTTTTTTTTTTTLPPETTTTSSTYPVQTTLVPPGERGFTGVLVVNGTAAGERLGPVVERIRSLGYGEVRGVVGAVQAGETSVYYVDGALPLAQRMATDLGYVLGEVPILPLADAPPVAGVGTAFVVVYLGPGALPDGPPTTDVPVDTEPTDTEPTDTEPTDTGVVSSGPDDAEPAGEPDG